MARVPTVSIDFEVSFAPLNARRLGFARPRAGGDFTVSRDQFFSASDLRSGSNPGAVIGTRYAFRRLFAVFAALGLAVLAPPTPGHAQAPPPLGGVAPFAVLAGSTVTNTGPTVLTGTAALPGDLGVSPGSAITGFPPGILTGPGASINASNAVAIQAQIDLFTAYQNLVGRPTNVNLTGQNLGGLTLVPGVYNFSSSAQLTGTLTLNGLGNPNSVFIINIGSTLTTASASTVALINGAQGGNVFWRVGSSATLGTTTAFAGDILALTSITLDPGATITCGAAWAHNGAVTLDDNTISLCNLLTGTAGPGGVILGPTGFPLFTSLLPRGASANDFSVATGLDNAIASGVTVPLAFLNLALLSPSALANALTQLSGVAAAGVAPTGMLAMSSFLSLVTNPFADRGLPPQTPPPLIYKTLAFNAEPDPSRWGIWAASYGGQYNIAGDTLAGTSAWSATTFGAVIGLDYRVTPYTTVGVALGGGSINFGLSGDLGGGNGQMLQAAVYSLTRINAAYISAALSYGWYNMSTNRSVTVAGGGDLTAAFAANDVGGRIEGGYRFAIPGVLSLPGFGITPYGALQTQFFMTPSYQETGAVGASTFALGYNAQTATMIQTELGAWFDETIALGNGAIVALWTRAAWAHDRWSGTNITAAFESLPGSSFTVFGALPGADNLLASIGAGISFRNGISLSGEFDSQLSQSWQTYGGYARLRYAW
jgi:uncharacterized protein with beta-barrel porin domain